MAARLVISPLVPGISDTFEVSNSAIGIVLSLMWAAYAFSQFPSGILADRFGERAVILTALGGTTVASILLSISPSFLFFAIMVVLLGSVAGLHYSVATTLLTRVFSETGRAIGIHVAGGPLAGIIAPIVAASTATLFGWRTALLIGAVIALPTFAAFALFIQPTDPRRPDQPMRDQLKLEGLISLVRQPEIAYTLVLAVIGAFCWQAAASFLPAFLAEGRGFSAQSAGLLFSLFFAIHALSQPVIGSLSDRYSRDSIVAGVMMAGFVGYGTLALFEKDTFLIAAVIITGTSMSWGAPVQSRFMDVLSDAERSAGFGLIRTVYMIVGSSGSVVVGATSDILGWSSSFGLLSLLMGAGLTVVSVNWLFDLDY